ncbi:hypothetical protein Trco_006155 [Trichoderma cornu-damae]|uniref:Uncharacterized protein n=1 Tax=Trichoderma cornu-damae TaxID=654480 RepID=A0A9P8QR61_9HYPO|nr:hypothetical protein Trco_006155 [Trichoderma cornu-damae]
MVSWFDKLQPLKPPAAARCLSCISSRSSLSTEYLTRLSVPRTPYMAQNYPKDVPLAPGVKLPTLPVAPEGLVYCKLPNLRDD